jgi:hypothetical protein
MATTKDRLEELTRPEWELQDHDAVALENVQVTGAEVPPAAAGNGPPVAVPDPSLRGRLLEPISGRWAVTGAVAWVVLLGIGIAVEPPPTNPNAVDPWFVNALGIMLLTAVVGASPASGCDGAGVWRPRCWHPACWWSLPSRARRPATTLSSGPGGSSSLAVGSGWWRPAALDCGGAEPRQVQPSTAGTATLKAVRMVLGRRLETATWAGGWRPCSPAIHGHATGLNCPGVKPGMLV